MESKRFFNKIIISSVVFFISILILLVPIIFYYKQFGQNGFSNLTSDWGNFGDYYGGILIPILTIINIIVLIYIANLAHKYEKKNIISQIKLSSYNNFISTIDDFLLRWKEIYDKHNGNTEKIKINLQPHISRLIITIESFIDGNEFLFQNLKQDDSYEKFMNCLNNLKKNYSEKKVDEFIEFKNNLLKTMQKKYL